MRPQLALTETWRVSFTPTDPMPARWRRADLAGRLLELSASQGGANLSLAVALVLDAQQEGEPAAWVAVGGSSFYPPDAAAAGVDLEALVVVRVADAGAAGRAADKLLRSGAFGLVVIDLGAQIELPMPLQARLVKLAQQHDAVALCLTEKPPAAPSLSSLVSLRAETMSVSTGPGTFVCRLEVVKDKRAGRARTLEVVCRGPDGLL